MESKLKLFGHPVHPMLIVFPLGLLATSLAFDVVHLVTGVGFWAEVAFWLITAGIVGGVVAAIAGWIDWSAIPQGTRARTVGLYHGLGNIVVLALFLVSWFWRQTMTAVEAPGPVAIGLSAGAVGLALVTAWLGGELVNRLGVGVYPGAHMNAPGTLSGRAIETVRPTGEPEEELAETKEEELGRKEEAA